MFGNYFIRNFNHAQKDLTDNPCYQFTCQLQDFRKIKQRYIINNMTTDKNQHYTNKLIKY